MREEVAARLTRLLTAATEENKKEVVAVLEAMNDRSKRSWLRIEHKSNFFGEQDMFTAKLKGVCKL